MIASDRVGAIVLAAGASKRFGGAKLVAPFRGRPLIGWVLDLAADLGFAEVVVVLGHGAETLRSGLAWRDERVVVNPHPDAGLSSSLRIGVASLGLSAQAALILLGDQPLVRRDVVERLLAALDPAGLPVVAPRYAGGGGANPVLIHRSAWSFADEARGDRGLGPLLAAHPELVLEVPVEGSNPDVDTEADLVALERVGAEHEPGS